MNSRRLVLAVPALALALAACDGNVNDDVTRIAITSRASVDFIGGESPSDCDNPSISTDGRYVAFQSFAPLEPLDTIGLTLDVYIRDFLLDTTQLVSVNSAGTAGGFGWSFEPMISPDGQYVVIQFTSSFENKKSAIETITPMLDPDGQWRVSGYYIK